jgi:serine/threonine protein kinase
LLIGADGHLKLTDFGLSQMGLLDRKDDVYEWKKVGTPATTFSAHRAIISRRCILPGRFIQGGMMESENKIDASCVGTPDYLAPEIFLGTGHGTWPQRALLRS